MRKKLLLLLTLIVLTVSANDKIITGFLPVYRTLPANYDYSRLTHLIYFSLIPKGDGGFSWTSGRDSLQMYNAFSSLKQKIADVPLQSHQTEKTKLILSIGGTSEVGSGGFNEIAADAETTKLFASRVKAILDLWEADGVDIDWEKWLKTTDDSNNHEAFLKTLADTLKPAGYVIFTDVSASNWNGQWFNTNAAQYVDYIQPMAYTFSGSWSSATGHNSSYDQAKSALDYWIGRGISKDKLVLGVPFYGIGFGGTDQVGAPFSGNSSIGQFVNYTQILDALKGGLYQHSAKDDSNGPYIYRSDATKEIIFYNDTAVMGKKADYLLGDNYAGAMIWELGQDSNDDLSLLDILAGRLIGWEKSSESIANSSLAANYTSMQVIKSGNRYSLPFGQDNVQSINLLDLKGRAIVQPTLSSNSFLLENIASGVYVLNVVLKSGNTLTTPLFH